MASRRFLLCLLVLLLSVSYIESRGGHGGSHSSGHSSGHSGGHSYGHSSGHSYGHSYGHSGSSSSHTYPSSSSGLSGTGSHHYGSSGSGSHTYPGGTGLSGSQLHGYNHRYSSRTRTYNSNSGHYGTHSSTSHENAPLYYKAPEYIYINQYRNSNSRYGDLLTGLSLHNYGRSQSHYHDHYYYDDYYRRRYDDMSSSSYSTEDKPQDSANCVLKVKENGREKVLKIPCEIVSTFTEESNKMAPSRQTQVNKTVCTSVFRTVPTTTVRPEYRTTEKYKQKSYTSEEIVSDILHVNLDEMKNYKDLIEAINNRERSHQSIIPPMNFTIPNFDFKMPNFDLHSESLTLASSMEPTNSTVDSLTGSVTTTVIPVSATMLNVTVCTTNYTFVDPLTEQGPPIDPKNMQCVVEIQTKDAFFRHVIDCSTLVEYGKLPEPKKDTILPERQKLKTWMDKPPWWLSLFIAV